MTIIVIEGSPTPWKAHQGFGRNSYSQNYKRKHQAQWQIKAQFNQKEAIKGPVRLEMTFHMKIPNATSCIKRKQMLNNIIMHSSRPDTTNLIKYAEDCLTGIVIEDDNQCVEIHAQKVYGEIEKTVIKVTEISRQIC